MVETSHLVGVGSLFVGFRRFLGVLRLGSEPSLFVEQGLRFLGESVALALLGFGHGRHDYRGWSYYWVSTLGRLPVGCQRQ